MAKTLPNRKPAHEALSEFLTNNNIELMVIPPDFGVSPEGLLVATSQSRIHPVYRDEMKEDNAVN